MYAWQILLKFLIINISLLPHYNQEQLLGKYLLNIGVTFKGSWEFLEETIIRYEYIVGIKLLSYYLGIWVSTQLGIFY